MHDLVSWAVRRSVQRLQNMHAVAVSALASNTAHEDRREAGMLTRQIGTCR